jgi:myosin-crossreactive antigen
MEVRLSIPIAKRSWQLDGIATDQLCAAIRRSPIICPPRWASRPLIKNGCITIVDSNWMITFFVYGKKYYRNQPDDVDIVHGYILFSMGRPGNFIKKPARECTGNEIWAEVLCHCGFEDKIDQILEQSYVSIAAIPTSRAS